MISLVTNRYRATPTIRTLISLELEDKSWLDRRAEEEGIAMTELVRRAVRSYREESESSSFERLLAATAGIWPGADGLDYQREIRAEWEEEG